MTRRKYLAGILFPVFVLLFFVSLEKKASADATTQPLIQQSDITYIGAFNVPTGDSAGCNINTGDHCFIYGGSALGYNPANNSLFIGGHDWSQALGEVKIPSIINTSQTALVLQNLADVTDGKIGTICSSPRNNKLGGTFVYNNRLITTAFVYYGPDCEQTKSHGASGLNLSIANDFPAFYTMNAAEPRGVSGWMTLVPPEWQSFFGGPALTGHCCSPGNQDTSNGPAATVFNPDDVGIKNPIPGTTLIYYPFPNHPLAPYASGNNYYNLATQMGGMAFPTGSRSVLFFGRQGTGPYCYGSGTSDPSLAGQIAPGGDTWCYDPSDGAKGTHAYPYRHQVWAYDANDLLAVKNGTKQSWEIIPQVWELTGMDSSGGARMRGATYDQATGRLYITQGYSDQPRVDVYQITVPNSTPDTTPPTSPTNLSASATSQSSITVSWTAATDNVGVTNYQVERCLGLSCSNFTQVGTPTASPFVDSGLTASTGYSYHVRAVDGAGNMSGWSNVVGATTQAPDTTPPSTPTSLSATATSSSTIDLTWTASTDNVGVTGYKVERCSGASCTTFTQVGTPTTNSYQDTGLSASATYRYQVRATDAANNNSSYSSIAQASTPVAPPTPTFVAEYETAWNSATSPKTTSNFSVQTGDILVAYAVNESSSSTIATPPTGTLAGTWTLKQTISATNYTYLRLWTMQVASNQTNVNVSFSNGSGNFGADILHFRNASSVGITAQANSATGNPTLTLNGISDNSTIVMVNGDWSAKTGARTYNTTQAGSFTETSAYADGSSYGVEGGYYANAGTAGNKTIGITAPTGMTWALAAIEIKGNPTAQPQSCNTVTTTNFSQAAYNAYGAPFDAFQTSTNLLDAKCTSSDTHTINLTTGITGDTTRIVYTKGYYYDPVTTGWTQYSGTCNGALNGEWCQGSVSATITNPNISTASAANPTYVVGMTCSVQGGSWKCGCRDATCSNFYWQVQGAGQ